MKKIEELVKYYYEKYKSQILYIFFGAITTFINIISYYVSFNVLGISNVVSTIIAWVFAVIFAFITNKIWVFDSKSWEPEIAIKELISFISVRLLTGLFDLAIMYIGVDVLKFNGMIMKILSNVFVLIANYIGSKLFIFKSTK